jgi:hypothetical protein
VARLFGASCIFLVRLHDEERALRLLLKEMIIMLAKEPPGAAELSSDHSPWHVSPMATMSAFHDLPKFRDRPQTVVVVVMTVEVVDHPDVVSTKAKARVGKRVRRSITNERQLARIQTA